MSARGGLGSHTAGRWRPSTGHLQVAGAAALWGTWSLFFRPAEKLGPVSPALEAFVIFAVVALALLPAALRSRPLAPRPALAWLGVLAFGGTDAGNALCFFAAMQRTSLAVAVLTHYLAPLLVALAAPLIFREPLRRSTLVALGISLLGLLLLLAPWGAAPARGWGGAVLGTASAFFYAANVLFGKGLQRWFGVPELLSFHMLAALPVLALAIPEGGFEVGWPAYAVLAAGSLAGGVLANVMFLRGLAAIPAPQAGVLTLIEPVVAVLIGALVWSEIPGSTSIAGTALVLGGAWIVIRPRDPGSR